MTAYRDAAAETRAIKKWRLLVVIAISLIEQGLLLGPAILVGQIVDRISTSNLDGTTLLLCAVLALGVTQAILWPIRERFVANVIQEMVLSRSKSLTQKIFGYSYDAFAASRVGAVTKIVERAIEGFENLLVMLLTRALPAMVSMLLVLVYFSYQVPIAIPLIILGAILYVVMSAIVLRWRRDFLDDVNDAEDDVAEYFALSFLAAPAIKVSGYVQTALQPLTKVYGNYAIAAQRLAFASGILKSTQVFITLLTTIFSIGAGLWVLQSQSSLLTAGDFVVVFSFVGIFMTNLAAVWQLRETLDEYDADSSALKELRTYEGPDTHRRSDLGGERYTLSIKKGATDVSPALSIEADVDLSIGDIVAVSGHSGAGKTLLLEYILGIKRSAGVFEFCGCDVNDMSEEQIAENMSYSSQKSYFLSGDIDYSIFFRKLADDERIKAKGIVKELKLERVFDGYEEEFSPDTLSGGERRRLGVLRALLDHKPLIILDEPTSELDAQLAQVTWNVIKKASKNSILLVATHDPAIIADSNKTINVSGFSVRSNDLEAT